MKNCPNCGTSNGDNARFCDSCGYEFAPLQGQPMPNQNYNGGYPPPPAQNPPPVNYAYPQYNAPAPAKSKATPILITVIAILLIMLSVIGTLIFMQHKNKNSGATAPVQQTTEAKTEAPTAAENAAPTEAAAVEQTEAVTEAATTETTAAPVQAAPAGNDPAKIKEAYIRTLTDFANSNDFNAYDHPSRYALYDIDNDGTEELIIRYEALIGNAEKLYTYKNGAYSIIAECFESSFEICPATHCVQWYGYGGAEVRHVLTMSDRGNSTDVMYKTSLSSGTTYICNDVGISQSEYDQLMAKYDAMNWINPSFLAFDTILSDSVVYNKPREYGGFLGVVTTDSTDLNVRERPSSNAKLLGSIPKGAYVNVRELDGYTDWYKVEYSEKNLIGYASAKYITDSNKISSVNNNSSSSNTKVVGKVITQNDPLNMRSAPDTNAEIVYKIPKGDYVEILSDLGEWLYVRYYKNDNSPVYDGYVSSKYIEKK